MPVAITPDNSFSFNLPDFSKTVINQVKVEYSELVEGKDDDNKFEIDLSKCETKKDSNENITHYIVDLELKNFYGCITKDMIKRYVDDKYVIEYGIENEKLFNYDIIDKEN